MNRLSLSLVAVAAVLASVPARAQVAGTQTLGVTVAEMKQVVLGWSVKKDMLGKSVYNEKNDKVGTVDDVIVSPDRLGVLLTSSAFARTGPFCQPGSLTLCEPGSFTPLGIPGAFFYGVGSPAGAFIVGADTVTLGICGAAPVRFYCRRAARDRTYFRTTWRSCPPFGRVKLKAQIRPGCVDMVGVFRWRDPSRSAAGYSRSAAKERPDESRGRVS